MKKLLFLLLIVLSFEKNVKAQDMQKKIEDSEYFQTEKGVNVDYRKVNSLNTMMNIRVYGNHLILPNQSRDIPHFVEHMIFKGTLAHPSRLSFIQYLNQHVFENSGSTTFAHSDYYFEINQENLTAAVERIVEQITSPLFSKEQIQKELKSYLDETSVITTRIEKNWTSKMQTCFREDLENASLISSKKMEEIELDHLQNEVFEFYRNTYHAKNIEVTIASPLPFELFKKLLRPLDQINKSFDLPKNNFVSRKEIKICEPEKDQSWIVIPMGHVYPTLSSALFLEWITNTKGASSLGQQLKQHAFVNDFAFSANKINKNEQYLIISLAYEQGKKNQDNEGKALAHIFQYAQQMRKDISESAVQAWNLSDELFVNQRRWGRSRFIPLTYHHSIDPDITVNWGLQIFEQIAEKMATLPELNNAKEISQGFKYKVIESMPRIPKQAKIRVGEKDRYPIYEIDQGYIFEPVIYSEFASYGKVFFRLRFQNLPRDFSHQYAEQIVQQFQSSSLKRKLSLSYGSVKLSAIKGEILVEIDDFSNQLQSLITETIEFISAYERQITRSKSIPFVSKINAQLALVKEKPIILIGELTHKQVFSIRSEIVNRFPLSFKIQSSIVNNDIANNADSIKCSSLTSLVFQGKGANIFSSVAGKMLYLLSVGKPFNTKMHFEYGYYWPSLDLHQSRDKLSLRFSIKSQNEEDDWRLALKKSIHFGVSIDSLLPLFEYHKKMVKSELKQRMNYFQDINEYYEKEMTGARQRDKFVLLKDEVDILDKVSFTDFYIPIQELLFNENAMPIECNKAR